MAKKLNKKQYDKLTEQQRIASSANDYSKMIMGGDKNDIAMKEYFRENICKHLYVGTNGGGDYCKSCGKTW